MSHHIYHTEAFVIASQDLGEASRRIMLYTRELGLLEARAQGVRKLAAKLRYGLSEYSLVRVSLVKGKNEWRIVGAIHDNLLNKIAEGRDGRVLIAHVFSLLERLIHGEGANHQLFDVLISGFRYLEIGFPSGNPISKMANAEIIFVLNILYHLGYLSKGEELARFVEFSDWTGELLDAITPIRQKVIETINSSFEHTQL